MQNLCVDPEFVHDPLIPDSFEQEVYKHKKPVAQIEQRVSSKKGRRPTLPLLRSTIGAAGLNFSVRNGKRWDPCAIAT